MEEVIVTTTMFYIFMGVLMALMAVGVYSACRMSGDCSRQEEVEEMKITLNTKEEKIS